MTIISHCPRQPYPFFGGLPSASYMRMSEGEVALEPCDGLTVLCEPLLGGDPSASFAAMALVELPAGRVL